MDRSQPVFFTTDLLKANSGFTLIEAMISGSMMAIGLYSWAAVSSYMATQSSSANSTAVRDMVVSQIRQTLESPSALSSMEGVAANTALSNVPRAFRVVQSSKTDALEGWQPILL